MRTTVYEGFELVYSRGTSLVERLAQGGAYEPELLGLLVDELRASERPTFVDVGANIGLISLAVLARVPEARVFAFEPGPHQRRLLEATIARNGLSGRLMLSPLALSERGGTAPFAVHTSRHASGDGFVDTGRAGPTRELRVRTESLDAWWEGEGQPPLDVVKIDTEGAELLVLRGAEAVLEAERPVVFLEIHPLNLRAYPYASDDVRDFLESRGYRLEPIAGETEFVARPE